MKIYSKILLITVPLIVTPAVIVGLIAFQISSTAIRSIAQGTTTSHLEYAKAIDQLGMLIGGLLVLSLLVALLTAINLTRRLTAPLQTLLTSVERSIRGESSGPIQVITKDEIGTLTNAFNTLIERMKDVNDSLEQRVIERTQSLEQRTLQLQTASEIAQEVVSSQEGDSLLERVVNLIQERFGFYHVSIYYPDELRQYAVLRAGAGEVGKLMVQRGYRVRIGDAGIVSHVVETGEHRVVNDVKTDFTYVKHPLLPDTACAAALPLKAGGRVIGVLDVESQKVNVFTQDMVAVLQNLADQLAMAIENTRSLEELRSNLRETRTQYQNYTQESWSRAAKGKKISGYQYDLSQITHYTRDLPEELRTRLMAGRAIPIRTQHTEKAVADNKSEEQHTAGDHAVLIAPLILSERLIGMLGIEDDDPDHVWSSEEIALLEAISNQVALTLDNARLVEETQLRSEQIRLLQEITAEAASHVNLNELLAAVSNRLLAGYNLLHCGVALLDTDGSGSQESGEQKQPSEVHHATTSTMTAYVSAPEAPGVNLVGAKLTITGDEPVLQALSTHKAVVEYGTPEREPNLNNQFPDTAQGKDNNSPKPTRLVVPLLTRGTPLGTITMEVADTERQFGEDDLRLLEQISLQVSAAVEVARNFEQTANRAEYERLIGEMTSRIRETLDVDTMVKTAVKEVQQALRLPEVVIRLGLPSTQASTPGATQFGPSTPFTGENE